MITKENNGTTNQSKFFLVQNILWIALAIEGCEALDIRRFRHLSPGLRVRKSGLIFIISVNRRVLGWMRAGHRVKKWVSHSTSDLHN